MAGQLSPLLFVLAARHWWQQADAAHGVPGLLREPRLRLAAIAMLLRQHEPRVIDEPAASCHLSRASFLRLFERSSGTAPARLLAGLRMDNAAVRLERGGKIVGAMGGAVGFQSE